MNSNFEQNVPFEAIIAIFAVLIIGGNFLKRRLRNRHLSRQGQDTTGAGPALSIEQRVSKNSSWAEGRISSKGGFLVFGVWTLAVVWNLTFGAAFIANFSNPQMKTGGLVMLGIFAVLGLIPVGFAVYVTLRHMRFGASYCMLKNKAGVLGKTLEGRIETSVDVIPDGDFEVELQCLETYHVGTGKERRSVTNTHWQRKITVPRAGIGSRAGIPFLFELPKSAPETGDQLARGDVNWQLSVKAPLSGVDYFALFVVPVFQVD